MGGIIRRAVAPILLVLLSACGSPPADAPEQPGATTAEQEAPSQASAPLARGRGGGAPEEPAPREPTPAGQDGPLPIGVAVATAGLIGQDEVAGADVAEDVLNAEGGIAGRPINIVIQDTGGDEQGARSAFQTLIGSAQVVGIVGPTLPQQAFAAHAIANSDGVPVLGPSLAANDLPETDDYVLGVATPPALVAPVLVDVALDADPTITRAAVAFAQDDAFSSAETVTFQRALQDRAVSIATVQTFRTADADLGAPTAALTQAEPDLVVVSGLAADGGALVRALREGGFDGTIVGGGGLSTGGVLGVCQAACEGLLTAQTYDPEAAGAANQAFRDAYLAREGGEPSQFAAQTFAAVQVLVDGLRAVDDQVGIATLDLTGLRTALRDEILAGRFETPLGPTSFSAGGEVLAAEVRATRIDMDEDGRTGRFVFVR